MIQPIALMGWTDLRIALISTSWHSYGDFPKEFFPTCVAYCVSVIVSDSNRPSLLSSQGNHLKSDMTQNFK